MSALPRATFGELIRASRWGYGWSKVLDCFVRIDAVCVNNPPMWRVELAKTGADVQEPHAHRRGGHVVWWGGSYDQPNPLDEAALFNTAPAITREAAVLTGYKKLYLNDAGEGE